MLKCFFLLSNAALIEGYYLKYIDSHIIRENKPSQLFLSHMKHIIVLMGFSLLRILHFQSRMISVHVQLQACAQTERLLWVILNTEKILET